MGSPANAGDDRALTAIPTPAVTANAWNATLVRFICGILLSAAMTTAIVDALDGSVGCTALGVAFAGCIDRAL